MITVVFFASVREAVGMPSVEMAGEEARNVAEVVQVLSRRGEAWQAALTAENLLVAVNQVMADPARPVTDGDEVAFFPPVTGG